MGFQGDISGSKIQITQISHENVGLEGQRRGKSYTLVFKPLYNCEGSGIMNILHNQPVDCLLVFSINPCSFNKLCLDPSNRVGLVVGID